MLRLLQRRVAPVLSVGIAAIAVLPLYWILLTSLRDSSAALTWPPRLIPDPLTLSLAAYAKALTTTALPAWILNSLAVTSMSVIVTLAVAIPAGYALSRSRKPEARLAAAAMLVSKVLPATVVITPLYVMIRGFGLINNPLAVVLGNLSFAVPFATWMLRSYFAKIPPELEEAALIDGDSRLGALRRVILPISAPALAAVGAYVFVVSWNDFLFARTFLAGGSATTVSVGIAMLVGELRIEWNVVMAAAAIATLPGLAVFGVLQRHLVDGVAAGNH